jgi:hypothetical protein
MKTSELTGAALDWAVAKCEFGNDIPAGLASRSTDWRWVGPIIERERIAIDWDGAAWCASDNVNPIACYGPTLLTAAMRCYVASKLGDEVDIPKELV